MRLSPGLAERPIRWIADDAVKFCRREIKRGNQYDAVILDPPTYGHGPTGEPWKIVEHLLPLLEMCGELTASSRVFILATCHSPGIGAANWVRMWPMGSSEIAGNRRRRANYSWRRRMGGGCRAGCMRGGRRNGGGRSSCCATHDHGSAGASPSRLALGNFGDRSMIGAPPLRISSSIDANGADRRDRVRRAWPRSLPPFEACRVFRATRQDPARLRKMADSQAANIAAVSASLRGEEPASRVDSRRRSGRARAEYRYLSGQLHLTTRVLRRTQHNRRGASGVRRERRPFRRLRSLRGLLLSPPLAREHHADGRTPSFGHP